MYALACTLTARTLLITAGRRLCGPHIPVPTIQESVTTLRPIHDNPSFRCLTWHCVSRVNPDPHDYYTTVSPGLHENACRTFCIFVWLFVLFLCTSANTGLSPHSLFWAGLGRFGQVWAGLGRCGQMWACIDPGWTGWAGNPSLPAFNKP